MAIRKRMRSNLATTCMLLWSTACRATAPDSYTLDGSKLASEFDGHGGLSAGATTRLLIDYPKAQQSEILDYLFKPNFGASLQVLKVEIGGDTQSTDGAEASHMHFRGDLGCARGYEGWLAKEAKARNPDIKIWSLSWGVPGWIGNETYFSQDNIDYQIQWIKCLKDQWGVDSDYLGLWNERPQGTVDYVIELRNALDAAGFKHVGITMETTWQELIDNVLTNSTFNNSVVAATKHYPCNTTSTPAITAHKKFWAGEDTPTHFGNWTAAGCWGRKLNQHWIKMNSTSSIAWAVVWSAANGVSGNFGGNAFLNASEPWSGHYDIPPVLWMNAHWHQFINPGWKFLQTAPDGGSGFLAGGGSYVTLVHPDNNGVFTLIVETLVGACGSPGSCDTNPITAVQNVVFDLKGSLSSVKHLYAWCSSSDAYFIYKGTVTPTSSQLSLTVQPDTICTYTTLSNTVNGSKGQYPKPPTSTRFPTTHSDTFASYADDALAWGFSDVYGSYAVRNHALTQLATGLPDGWAPTNYDPLTMIGDEQWTNVAINVSATINHTDPSHYVRLCGGCGDISQRVIAYGCPSTCCFNLTATGNWSVGETSGMIADFKDTAHSLQMVLADGSVMAMVDGKKIAEVPNTCTTRGTAGVGCGKYHMCSFKDFSLAGGL